MRFDVTVSTDYTFEVEAETEAQAEEMAIQEAEDLPGNFFDWQVEETEGYEE